MTVIVTEYDFAQPVEQVFEYFSEHENLKTLFNPIRIERLTDGDDGTRNGPGSSRKMSLFGLAPFVEQTTEVTPNESIVYKLIKGAPVKYHRGEMKFSSNPDGGTHLHYEIEIVPSIPGGGPLVGKILGSVVKRGYPAAAKEI